MPEINLPNNELNISELSESEINDRSTYAYIYDIDSDFEQQQAVQELMKRAKELKVTGVMDNWRAFKKEEDRKNKVASRDVHPLLITDEQPIQLYSTWEWDENGITKVGIYGREYAAYQPLLITTRYENVDTGTEKLKLAFQTNGRWRYVTVPKSTLASTNKIVELADFGISVTSKNAKAMVDYLQELEMLNYNDIPTVNSTSRLGWINEEEFMPYTENIQFDGDPSLNRLFNSVHTKGSEEKWMKTVKDLMKDNFAVKLAVAASATSPLLPIVNAQPFFVHFWSDMSATGKTLIIMIAASLWGNPNLGEYVQSFNSTTVALERMAETLNNCPMVMDELQLSKGSNGNTYFDVYKLAQGQGRGRGTKTGGIEKVPQWCNTIITSGETTILKDSDGQGAYARTLEYEIEDVLFSASEGNKIANIIKENYGFAGPKLIEIYKEMGPKVINELFSKNVKELNELGWIQDKQVILASALLTASNVVSGQVFGDVTIAITQDEIIPLLTAREESSIEVRAYETITNWIASNKKKFSTNEFTNETLGVIEDGYAYIIKNEFNKLMKDEGFNPRSVLSSFKKKDLIVTSQEGNTVRRDVQKRINGIKNRCVQLKLDIESEDEPYDL